MAKQKQVKSAESGVGSRESGTTNRITKSIDVNTIGASRFEPQARRRAKFRKEDTEKLGDSIVKSGLEQPILVRPIKPLDDFKFEYEIVFGERRWLAHKAKNLKFIDCFVKELSDAEVIERQYQENHERQDNDPLDDAFYFKYLQDTQGYSVKDLSLKFNISEKAVVNKLKFNDLIDEAKQELSDGILPLGHALYLSKFPPETQKQIVEEQMAYEWGDKDDGPQSLTEFKEQVEKELLRKLASAPFNPEDPRLHLKGLVCSACPDRTGYTPMLFDGADNWENDSCLNRSCFQSKININLRLKREDIAKNYAKQGEYPEDAVKKVPLVTERNWVDKDDIPFSGVSEKDVLKNQKIYESKDCEDSQPALAIKGERFGQEVYICQNKECEIHNTSAKAKEQPEEMPDWKLEHLETNFNRDVSIKVRQQLFSEALKFWNGNFVFWEFADLIHQLLAAYLKSDSYYLDDLIPHIKNWEKVPKKFDDIDRNLAFVQSLETNQLSQLLFLLSFRRELTAEHWFKNTPEQILPLQQIAKNYTKLDYRKLDAEARVQLAPDEFKSIAEGYLLRVINGVEEEPPKFWVKEGKADGDADDE